MSFDLDCVLPLVTKPSRYTGGELNSISADCAKGSKVRVALCLPDVYEIGMSNYGLRILYSLLNRVPSTTCERVYTPWPDMADRLRSSSTQLYGLESHRPLSEFNVLGFSLQSELSYTNVLYTLDLGGIPLRSAERDAKHPLIIAGGPCCVNPLPMSRFIDCFCIGDGEEVIADVVAAYRNWNRANRDDLLQTLAGIGGVYVPVKHGVGGQGPGGGGQGSGVGARMATIHRRVVSELREDDFPYPPVLPSCEIVHDRLTLEIARGCTQGCRFCQAGMLNRPYRYRPVDEVVRLAEKGIRATGWEEVSLLSLSTLDYPYLLELISRLNASLGKSRVAVSLPSVRGEGFSPELANALKLVRKSGLTFAPETASPRLRALVNKSISEEKILESVRSAVGAGWTGLKLYFMVGLPGETMMEALEIARFVDDVARTGKAAQVRFNLSPFVPKPHTPLQRAAFESVESLNEKILSVKAGLRRRNVKAKWESPEVSCLQAALARGDEKLGPVLEWVYRKGGVFQEWTEKFDYNLWLAAFSENALDLNEYLRARPADEPLPWSFIDVGVSQEFLDREARRAEQGEFTPDCRQAGCTDCGLQDAQCAGMSDRSDLSDKSDTPVASADVEYGRYRRKILAPEQFRTKFRVKYSVGEAFRYAAHLDIVRAVYRALRRSEVPVAYSQGFSPRPVVAFGPPLPVGLTSAEEYLDLTMAGHYPGDLVRDLGPAMPRDLRVLDVRPVFTKVSSLGASLVAARYALQARDLGETDRISAGARVAAIPGVRQLDFLEQAGPGVSFDLVLAMTPGIKLFPALQQLFERDEATVRCWRIQRRACFMERDGKLVSPMEEL
jgi:radical SAM family uncharacterized protein